MIIDSLKYNGECACGKRHYMQTEFCVISAGCLKEMDEYLAKYGLNGKYTVAVYDKNTYEATFDRRPKVDKEVVLDPIDLHANEKGTEYLKSFLPNKAELLIAVGAGTIHDLTRYCADVMNIDFVSCPTAASVDGFCSSVAAMTWNGCKKTLTAVAPKIVIADIDIIKKAPVRLAKSGFGDMIGKYVALTDWKISRILTGEFYCDKIANMTMNATQEVLSSIQGIIEGENEAYEKLTFGLLLSGLAMQMMGNSRPASGAEHHISHLIEMSPCNLALNSEALHGEKVGVGTLLAIEEYQRLANCKDIGFFNYQNFDTSLIFRVFGEEKTQDILKENENDAALEITADILSSRWSEVCYEISKLPKAEHLKAIYEKHGIKSRLCDIQVEEKYEGDLLEYSPMVRNRLTLMRIRKCIKAAKK